MSIATVSPSNRVRQVFAGRAPSTRLLRGLVLGATAAAAVGGLLITDGAAAARAAARAGEDLTRLLRAMAAIKALMAAGVIGGVFWRLGSPVGLPRLAAYAAACVAMAVGPGLIWNMADLGAGALLLHTGLIGALVLLWRDPETSRLLSSAVTARRMTSRRP